MQRSFSGVHYKGVLAASLGIGNGQLIAAHTFEQIVAKVGRHSGKQHGEQCARDDVLKREPACGKAYGKQYRFKIHIGIDGMQKQRNGGDKHCQGYHYHAKDYGYPLGFAFALLPAYSPLRCVHHGEGIGEPCCEAAAFRAVIDCCFGKAHKEKGCKGARQPKCSPPREKAAVKVLRVILCFGRVKKQVACEHYNKWYAGKADVFCEQKDRALWLLYDDIQRRQCCKRRQQRKDKLERRK